MSRAGLLRALAAVVEPPDAATVGVAEALELGRAPTAAEHTDLFVLELHPYASVHLGPEGMLGGDARDRVAGFLRALEVVPPVEPDRLGVLLAALADLAALDDDGAPRAGHARGVLLHEHLGSWVGRLLARVAELGAPPHRRWAVVLEDVLADERARAGAPEDLPAALREAPAVTDPRDAGAGGLVAEVLAPVRSGLVLARADLTRSAAELGLGVRVGERAYALRALIGQDPAATLGWLASEAVRQRAALDPVARTGGAAVAEWWDRRLGASAALLADLAEEARTT